METKEKVFVEHISKTHDYINVTMQKGGDITCMICQKTIEEIYEEYKENMRKNFKAACGCCK